MIISVFLVQSVIKMCVTQNAWLPYIILVQLYKQLESCQKVNRELVQSDRNASETAQLQLLPVIDTLERLKLSEEMVKVTICMLASDIICDPIFVCQTLQLEKRTLDIQLEEAQQKLAEAKDSVTPITTASLPVDMTKVGLSCLAYL